MSAQDEVAQMVERLRNLWADGMDAAQHESEAGGDPGAIVQRYGFLDDAAALLERLQRERAEAKAKVDGGRVEMVTDGYLAQLVSANHALRSRLAAAKALLRKARNYVPYRGHNPALTIAEQDIDAFLAQCPAAEEPTP